MAILNEKSPAGMSGDEVPPPAETFKALERPIDAASLRIFGGIPFVC